jgi:putative addiction module component (TIGR02574 family)
MALPEIDIEALSPSERIELAERLWNSLRASPEEVPLTAAQEEELDRRREAYREDRDRGEALSEIGRR